MDFDDTPEEAAFRAEARACLESVAPAEGRTRRLLVGVPERRRRTRRSTSSAARSGRRTLADDGWAGITWPKEYGGRGGTGARGGDLRRGAGPLRRRRRASSPSASAWPGRRSSSTAPTPQKRALPPAAPARRRGVVPAVQRAGRRLRPRRAVAPAPMRDGDEWVVNGQKVWTSGAQSTATAASCSPAPTPNSPKHRGHHLLPRRHAHARDRRSARSGRSPARRTSTRSSSPTCASRDDNVVGEVNAGWGVAITTLANERVLIGGGGTGTTFDDLARAGPRAAAATDDPLVRQGLAAAYTRDEILRYLGHAGAHREPAAARRPGAEASVMKLLHAGTVRELGDLASAIEGADGHAAGADAPADGAWQQQFLSAGPSIRIGGGTDEIQRNIIGERVLGLPGELRADKDVPVPGAAEAVVRQGPDRPRR